MEKQIFTFGKPAEGESFTDREAESARLSANFRCGINTFLLSPRRWGKTSLVQKVMREVRSTELQVVFVDVFKCKTALEFSETVAAAVLAQTSTKTEEFIENAKKFLGRLNVGLSLSPDPINSMDIRFGITPGKDHGLGEQHGAGIHEAHDHDGGGGGGLDDCGHDQTQQQPLKAIGGQVTEDGLELTSRALLQSVAHNVHSVEEQSKAAD